MNECCLFLNTMSQFWTVVLFQLKTQYTRFLRWSNKFFLFRRIYDVHVHDSTKPRIISFSNKGFAPATFYLFTLTNSASFFPVAKKKLTLQKHLPRSYFKGKLF